MGWKRNDIEIDSSVGQLSQGVHPARCVKSEIKDKKSGEGENLVLTFESMKGGEKGRQVRSYLPLDDNMRWKLSEAFLALGNERGAGIAQENFDGKKCRLVIEHEDYQGEPRAQIKKFLPMAEEGEFVEEGTSEEGGKKPEKKSGGKKSSGGKKLPF